MRYWSGPKKTSRKGRNFRKSPKKFGPNRVLSQKDEFLLKLMKLRLGSTNADLAQRFGISRSTVSTIFNSWAKILANELKCLIYNPSMEVVKKTLPKKLKKPGYCKVRHIIDCTEIFYRDPKQPCDQSINMVRLQASQYCKNPSFNHPKWGLQLHLRGMGWAHLRCPFDKGIRVLQHP